MGLFDKVLGSKDEKLNEAEGFAGVALCAVAADGVLEPEEQVGLIYSLRRMKLYGDMNERQFQNVLEKLVRIIRSEGVEGLLTKASAAVRSDLRGTAFAVAADLIMTDGHVDGKEKAFLERIQKSLAVDDATAVKVVEVMAIKNLG